MALATAGSANVTMYRIRLRNTLYCVVARWIGPCAPRSQNGCRPLPVARCLGVRFRRCGFRGKRPIRRHGHLTPHPVHFFSRAISLRAACDISISSTDGLIVVVTQRFPSPFANQTLSTRNRSSEPRLLFCAKRRAACRARLVLAAMIAPMPMFTIWATGFRGLFVRPSASCSTCRSGRGPRISSIKSYISVASNACGFPLAVLKVVVVIA